MFHALGEVQLSVAPYIWTLFTVLAACIFVLAWAALADSGAETWPVRAVQRWRLGRTRMVRMLRRRHVPVGAYVRLLPVAQLKEQIQTCQTCGLDDLCDRALAGPGPSRSVFSFCPNRPVIERCLMSPARAAARRA